jgi:predicted TIM-barrel fold metal-dependent hydrolase
LWPEESLDDFDGWKKAVNEMSKLDNVALKISGFGEWKTNWSTDFISDYIKVAIDSFGTKRCMFASNFPVDKFFSKSPYQSFWLAYMKIISKFSHTEINDLLMKNAEKYYRI